MNQLGLEEAAQANAKLLQFVTAVHSFIIIRRHWLDNLLTFEKISGRHLLSMKEGTRKAPMIGTRRAREGINSVYIHP